MPELFMGVDIGTSSVRAALFDRSGRLLFIKSEECGLAGTADGKAEMDPDAIVKSVFSVIRSLVEVSGVGKGGVAGVSFSCHMHSLMAVDREGRPLTPLMLWADTRAGGEARFIEEHFDAPSLYRKTGCRVQHPMYPLSKLLWIKNHAPDIFSKAYKFITIKEYIFFTLFGTYAVDYTLASSQGYYNIHLQDWDDTILREVLGLEKGRLGDVVECTHMLHGFKKELEPQLGLSCDTPFAVGSGDGILANVGSGVFDASGLTSTVGTSGAVRTTVSSPLLDPCARTWCYAFTKDKWVAGGAINNGGIVLKWLRDEFRRQFEDDAEKLGVSLYALFDEYAKKIPAGSEGLFFLPYLTGERSPDWNADARGIMFGLSYTHGRGHIARAAMEGVMYRMYSVYEVLAGIQDGASRIIASGGYSRSDIWMQIQADVFDREVLVTDAAEVSALGAAYVAMCGVGALKFGTRLAAMEPVKVIKPNAEAHEVYRKTYRRSAEIYDKLYG